MREVFKKKYPQIIFGAKRSIFSFIIFKKSELLMKNQAKWQGVNQFIYSFFSIRINQCDLCLNLINKSLF